MITMIVHLAKSCFVCNARLASIKKWQNMYLFIGDNAHAQKYIPRDSNVRVMLCFYVLSTSKVMSGRVPTCDSEHSWRLFYYYPCCKSGHQHHDLTFSTLTLSWHWANQSLLYPNKDDRQATNISFVSHWSDSIGNRTPDLSPGKPVLSLRHDVR